MHVFQAPSHYEAVQSSGGGQHCTCHSPKWSHKCQIDEQKPWTRLWERYSKDGSAATRGHRQRSKPRSPCLRKAASQGGGGKSQRWQVSVDLPKARTSTETFQQGNFPATSKRGPAGVGWGAIKLACHHYSLGDFLVSVNCTPKADITQNPFLSMKDNVAVSAYAIVEAIYR